MAATGNLPDPNAAATHELAFIASIPPLGYASYTIESLKGETTGQAMFTEASEIGWKLLTDGAGTGEVAYFGKGQLQAGFSKSTGIGPLWWLCDLYSGSLA
jgi:hypothetical protein